ncbi:DUF4157 domain-containing protein [Ruminococcaceae bacterium OttesenSCG-928-L11]|nr:DUF4157 domain-containing protein [Ruminococcaceae bacterium OttesenSCG-928-L11]
MSAYQDELRSKAKPLPEAASVEERSTEKQAGPSGGGLSDWISQKKSIELPGEIRQKMEGSFRADFSGLKLFESPEIGAKGFNALTQGNQVGFDTGAFSPGSREGQELLGHELSHVVSQAKGHMPKAAAGAAVQDPSFESRADAEGARAAMGKEVGSGPAISTASAFSSPVASMPVQGGPKKWLSAAQQKLKDGKEWLGEKATKAKEWGKEKVHELKENAADKVVDVKRKIRENVGTKESKAKAQEKKRQRRENLDNASNEIMESLGLKDALGIYSDDTRSTGDKAKDMLKDNSEEITEKGFDLAGKIPVVGGFIKGGKSIYDAGKGVYDHVKNNDSEKRDDVLKEESFAMDTFGKVLDGGATMFEGVKGFHPALGAIGGGLSTGSAIVKGVKAGFDIASTSKDIKNMKKVQEGYDSTQKSTEDYSDKRLHNMVGMGINAKEHDRRQAVSTMVDSGLDVMGGVADMAGASGIGGKVASGLKFGNKLVTNAIQSHYDGKAQKERINQEFSALSDENGRESAVTLDEAHAKTRARMNEVRDQETRADGKKTRYTQSELKAAISRSIAGNSKGDAGIHTAIISKYVLMMRDPSQIEKTAPILDAFGFDVDKIKQKLAGAQNEDEVASALPSEEAIAKALGYRGKDRALKKQISRTKEAMEKQKAEREQKQQQQQTSA